MSQWWRDISFLHWRVDPDLVAPLLPPGVRPDVYDGSSWVGLIPFRMVDGALGPGAGPPLRDVPRDQRPPLLRGRRRAARGGLPLAGGRPAGRRGRRPAGLRGALPVGPDVGGPSRPRRGAGGSHHLLPHPAARPLAGRADASTSRSVRRSPSRPTRPLPHGPFRAAHPGPGRTLWVPNTHGPGRCARRGPPSSRTR